MSICERAFFPSVCGVAASIVTGTPDLIPKMCFELFDGAGMNLLFADVRSVITVLYRGIESAVTE